jgi:hypothetical protein
MHAIDASPLIYGRRPEQIGTGPSPALSKGDVMDRLVALMSRSQVAVIFGYEDHRQRRLRSAQERMILSIQSRRSGNRRVGFGRRSFFSPRDCM